MLIVDDEELLVKSCGQILSSEGYTVFTEGRGKNALESVRRHRPDVVLTDLMLPDLDGLSLLKKIKKLAPETLVVMITGFATVDSSVEAIRAGAYDYIPKPFTATQLRILIGRAAQQVLLVRDNAALRDQLRKRNSFESIIGNSESIQRVFAMVSRVAPTDTGVLISGESGTGKELIARAVHANSRRSDRPFRIVNCAATPSDHLLESELFGHEKGAFTGARTAHRGALEAASGGTVFLDEISEMSTDLQARLIRAIQERKVRRLGSEKEIPIDVRWISATSRDPEQAVREGRLRQDLLSRLNVVTLKLPPLRMRREDIPALALHFLRLYAQGYDRAGVRFSPAAMRVLGDYHWPGNVRELHNTVESVVSLSVPGQEITPDDLPEEVRRPAGGPGAAGYLADQPLHEARFVANEAFEKEYLRDLLRRHGGNVSQAARAAGIDRKTLHRMLAKYAVKAHGDEDEALAPVPAGAPAPPAPSREEAEPFPSVSFEGLVRLNEMLTAENERLKLERERLRVVPENAGWMHTFSFFGTLVRSVAHDLRNTFEKMIMGVELLRDDPDAPPHFRRTLDVLAASAHRGEQLFREMLRELAELSPATEEVDLLELVLQVYDEMQGQLPPAVTLDVARPARRPGKVRCNPHLTQVVLLELIRNAAKALGPGEGRIRVRLRAARETVSMVVEDNGPGIPRIVQDYLRNPGGTPPAGTGTGLPLSAQLVRSFGGELRVERVSARGSTVSVALPRASRTPGRRPAAKAEADHA